MSAIEFPYSTYRGYELPIVPINIRGEERWHEVWMFVDSGATYSVMNFQEAERFKIDPKSGRKLFIKVGDGSYISVYLVELAVRVMDAEFNAHIGFSEELGIGFNIMGRKDFFSKFTVCFDEKRKVMQFK